MLSFYVVFMCHHIKPNSVSQYLLGIVSSLEPHFPNVCEARNGLLISYMLAGMWELQGFRMMHKCVLTEDDLLVILTIFTSGSLHNLLTISIIFTGCHALMHLGESTLPDNEAKWMFLKTILHHTIIMKDSFNIFIHAPYPQNGPIL